MAALPRRPKRDRWHTAFMIVHYEGKRSPRFNANPSASVVIRRERWVVASQGILNGYNSRFGHVPFFQTTSTSSLEGLQCGSNSWSFS
jgi:hypothetical protein